MICPVQASCGGCPTLHLDRQAELDKKAARVGQVFEEAGLANITQPCISGDSRVGYRNRLRMQVVDGRAELFNQAKEQGCVALRPELWAAITTLRQTTRSDPTLLSGVAHLEVRVDHYARIGLSFVTSDPDETNGPGRSYSRLQAELGTAWVIANRTASPQPALRYDVASTIANEVPIDAFVQVNSEVNRLLVSYIRQVVSAGKHCTFIDLFCGAGNLTVPLVADGLTGTAVERNGSGPHALVNQVDGRNLTVVTGDVYGRLVDLTPADVVLSNPPRSGIKTGHQALASLVSNTMICIGCEPKSLAADIVELTKHGLEVDEIQTFDMFPATDHIETVVVLKRLDV